MRLFILLLVLCSGLSTTAHAEKSAHHTTRSVLVTGASTGIGRLTAETLAGQGFHVYAGARKPADLAALNAIDNITAVRLDVTSDEDIAKAVATVKAGGGLWGLVNNAGINIIDPLIEADIDDMKWLFEVNVFGIVRVTKAFAPMLIESKGRVVNISSISGVLTGLPAYGGYAMTKHAVEAYSDQLASEMAKFGVHVAAVEPGNFKSQIGMTRCKGIVRKNRQYVYFAEEMQPHFDYCQERVSKQLEAEAAVPEPVAAAVADALSSDTPRQHYLVTPNPFESQIVMRKLFEEMLNYNEGATHPFTREQLLEIMDEEQAYASGEKERPPIKRP